MDLIQLSAVCIKGHGPSLLAKVLGWIFFLSMFRFRIEGANHRIPNASGGQLDMNVPLSQAVRQKLGPAFLLLPPLAQERLESFTTVNR